MMRSGVIASAYGCLSLCVNPVMLTSPLGHCITGFVARSLRARRVGALI